MREILFRGIAKDHDGKNTSWVYGFYCKAGKYKKYGGSPEECSIIRNSSLSENEVDPETVGQYTGSDDKNGKKIYEKDILLMYGNSGIPIEVVFEDGAFIGKNKTKYAGLHNHTKNIVVIGNTIDNPELLKQEQL